MLTAGGGGGLAFIDHVTLGFLAMCSNFKCQKWAIFLLNVTKATQVNHCSLKLDTRVYLKRLAQAKIIKKSVILFRVLNMTI